MRNGLLLIWERGLNEGSKLRYHQCWTCEFFGGVSDRNMGETLPIEVEMTQLHQQSPPHHGDNPWKLETPFKAVQFISASSKGSLAYLSIYLSRSDNLSLFEGGAIWWIWSVSRTSWSYWFVDGKAGFPWRMKSIYLPLEHSMHYQVFLHDGVFHLRENYNELHKACPCLKEKEEMGKIKKEKNRSKKNKNF